MQNFKTPYDPTVDRSYLNSGVREIQEIARQFNKNPEYRGIGASLGGPESDAMIVSVGAINSLSEPPSTTQQKLTP